MRGSGWKRRMACGDRRWQMGLQLSPCCQPPPPPLDFSNRFTLRTWWPPISPDSKGEHLFAESDSGEGEFIVFNSDFWEAGVERGLGVSTGFTENSEYPPLVSPGPWDRLVPVPPRLEGKAKEAELMAATGTLEGGRESRAQVPKLFLSSSPGVVKTAERSHSSKREIAQLGCPKGQRGPHQCLNLSFPSVGDRRG